MRAIEASGINICFSTSDGIISWILRKIMRVPASHSVITFRSQILGKVLVLEAQGRGFVAVPWKRWVRKNTLLARYSLRLPAADIRHGLSVLSDRLGDPYDTWSLLGYLLRGIAKGRNPFDSKAKLVCSEAVALFLNAAGVEKVGHIGSITPKDLWSRAQRDRNVFSLEWSHPKLKQTRDKSWES